MTVPTGLATSIKAGLDTFTPGERLVPDGRLLKKKREVSSVPPNTKVSKNPRVERQVTEQSKQEAPTEQLQTLFSHQLLH